MRNDYSRIIPGFSTGFGKAKARLLDLSRIRIPSSDRARRRIFIIRPKRPAVLPRDPVHVRVVLPRCTRKVARGGLVLAVKHKLALGLLGCGPGARALVLTLGRSEMSTACHRSPVFCLPRSFISASFVVGCMANFSEISPHFFPHGKFQ